MSANYELGSREQAGPIGGDSRHRASPGFSKQENSLTTRPALSVGAPLPLNAINFTQLPVPFVLMASLMT